MATNREQDRGQHDQAPGAVSAGQGIHVVAKPIGPVCNLNCEYCFYLEKQALFSPVRTSAGNSYVFSFDDLAVEGVYCSPFS